ncbi:MAG: VOC family protein [Turicibacter sp.]|nr:VOC family protein [Turicibacter sp.]
MKINAYIEFNGNCEEAIKFYEKAFGEKAEIMRFGDMPPNEGYTPPPDTANLIMNARLPFGDSSIYLCDLPPTDKVQIGYNVNISAEFDDFDKAKSVFTALSEGGKIFMPFEPTFWTKGFGSLRDKFDIPWQITLPTNG